MAQKDIDLISVSGQHVCDNFGAILRLIIAVVVVNPKFTSQIPLH